MQREHTCGNSQRTLLVRSSFEAHRMCSMRYRGCVTLSRFTKGWYAVQLMGIRKKLSSGSRNSTGASCKHV